MISPLISVDKSMLSFFLILLKFLKILFVYFWLHYVLIDCTGFLWLWGSEATVGCRAPASHCSGFSCCGAQVLGAWASVVVANRLRSRDTQA